MTFIKSRKEENFKMITENTEYPEVKQAVAHLTQLSSDEATQILYDCQLKKTIDERVLQREAIEKSMLKGMRKGKIAGVVKLITKYGVDVDEAMKDLELAAEYKYKVLAQLKNNTTD